MTKKLSDHQLFAIAACYAIGDTIIAASSNSAALAQQDAWISSLIAGVLGIPFVFMYYNLGKYYPDKTLVDILETSFGKWVGWIISAIFVVYICFLSAAQVTSYIGNFIQTEYMTETPLYALNLLLGIALAVGLLYGLEAASRAAEVFIIVVLMLMGLAIVFNFKNVSPNNLLPIFEKGITPSLKGALSISSYLTWPFIFFLMIFPTQTNLTKKTRNAFLRGFLLAAVIDFICTIMAIMILGSTIAARSLYPTYLMSKEVEVGILTRIEGVVSFSWIITEYLRTFLYFYAGIIGFCQLFKINNHKRIVLPLVFLIVLFSGLVYPTAAYQAKYDTTTWAVYSIIFGAILPIILLIIAKIKKTKSLE